MDERKATILIVDDEEFIRDVLSREFESEGYNCVVAASCEDAVWKAFMQDFDLVIMDIDRPGLSTMEALARITASHPDTCVLVTTATADTRTAVEAMQAGAYDYLSKTLNLNDFAARVAMALERRKLLLENRSRQRALEQRVRQLEAQLQQYQLKVTEAADIEEISLAELETARRVWSGERSEPVKAAVGVKNAVRPQERANPVEEIARAPSVGSGILDPWYNVAHASSGTAVTMTEEPQAPASQGSEADKTDLSESGVELIPPYPSSQQILQLENVSRSYRMGQVEVKALKNVTLSVNRGEFIVIMGPSGSGKTTLLNLIGGMDSPSSGKVLVDGIDTGTLDDRGLTDYRRNHIGFVFQFFNLLPTLTARENVEFAAELVKKPRDVMEMLDMVGLRERADHYPSELSGGEQQRLAIARALVKDPPILLCDEPTGELDFETGKHILNELRMINKVDHKTVLLVTHNTAIGDIAHRVIRLRSGEIVEVKPNPSPLDPLELKW